MPYGIPFLQPQFYRPRQSGGAGFVPTDIAGCEIYVKGELITGLSDGDPVPLWEDFSGNGNDEAQASGSNQPSYQTAELNGKAVVRFDGSSDFMSSPFELPQPCSVFVVLKSYIPGGNATFVGSNAAASCYINTSGGFGLYAGSVIQEASGAAGWCSYIANLNGASSEIYRDGVLVASGNAGAMPFSMFMLLGAFEPSPSGMFGSDLAEVAAYGALLSGTDITNLISYTASEYGI